MGVRSICLTANSSWYLFNFRRSTITALLEKGYNVSIVAPRDEYSDRLLALGCGFQSIDLNPVSKNPLREFLSVLRYAWAIKVARPDLIFSFTPKPNIYGGIAARSFRVPFVPNVAGVGSQFRSSRILNWMLGSLYKVAFSSCPTVLFQNEADLREFTSRNIVEPSQADRVLGSGVDLSRFSFQRRNECSEFTFLFVGRLLLDKGVGLYIEAARNIRKKYGKRAVFRIVGIHPNGHPNSISSDILVRAVEDGVVEFEGSSDSVWLDIARADCVVLPSFYGEGVPKTLLESAAIGRPAVATDMPGCRDAVFHNETGLLCEPRSLSSLQSSLEEFLNMPVARVTAMGENARRKAEELFDDRKNVEVYLRCIEAVAQGR